jgi:hypothetical protein
MAPGTGPIAFFRTTCASETTSCVLASAPPSNVGEYGGLEASVAKRLKELERENSKLKRIVPDQLLKNSGAEGDREGKLVGRRADARPSE